MIVSGGVVQTCPRCSGARQIPYGGTFQTPERGLPTSPPLTLACPICDGHGQVRAVTVPATTGQNGKPEHVVLLTLDGRRVTHEG